MENVRRDWQSSGFVHHGTALRESIVSQIKRRRENLYRGAHEIHPNQETARRPTNNLKSKSTSSFSFCRAPTVSWFLWCDRSRGMVSDHIYPSGLPWVGNPRNACERGVPA